MKPQDQIIALANLDGWTLKLEKGTDVENHDEPWEEYRWISGEEWLSHDDIPSYLTNGDEMRRLIGKQNYTIRARIIRFLSKEIEWDNYGITERAVIQEMEQFLLATSETLAEALLRAHGLWKVNHGRSRKGHR